MAGNLLHSILEGEPLSDLRAALVGDTMRHHKNAVAEGWIGYQSSISATVPVCTLMLSSEC